MGLAVTHTIGVDDRAVDEGLTRVEGKLEGAMHRIAGASKESVEPFHNLMKSFVGRAGLVTVFGAASSEMFELGTRIGEALFGSEKLAEKAREEAEQRERSLRAIDGQVRAIDVQLGNAVATPMLDAVAQQLRDIEPMLEAAQAKLSLSKSALTSAQNYAGSLLGTVDPNEPYGPNAQLQQQAVDRMNRRERERNEAQSEFNELQKREIELKKQISQVDRAQLETVAGKVRSFDATVRIAGLKAEGHEIEALRIQEWMRYDDQQRALYGMRSMYAVAGVSGSGIAGVPAMGETALAIEHTHAQEMDRISDKAHAIDEANGLQQKELDLAEARGKHQATLVRAIEAEIEMRQTIAKIEGNTTLTMDQQDAMVRQSARIAGLSLNGPGGAPTYGASIGSGSLKGGGVLGQVFGGSALERAAQEGTSQKQLTTLQDIKKSIDTIAHNGMRIPSTFN